MPLFMKRGRKFGLTSASLDINDFKTTAIDNDLASVSADDDTIASAKAVKAYVDGQIGANFAALTDTTISSSKREYPFRMYVHNIVLLLLYLFENYNLGL